jgi:hypothetical protein
MDTCTAGAVSMPTATAVQGVSASLSSSKNPSGQTGQLVAETPGW